LLFFFLLAALLAAGRLEQRREEVKKKLDSTDLRRTNTISLLYKYWYVFDERKKHETNIKKRRTKNCVS